MSKRLNGELNFSLYEAIVMHEKWFPDIPIEILFSREDTTKKTAAPDCQSDTAEKKKSCISGITITLHGDKDPRQSE